VPAIRLASNVFGLSRFQNAWWVDGQNDSPEFRRIRTPVSAALSPGFKNVFECRTGAAWR
jgi:hypothetical protein